ncbi:MAG: hypothetical protein V1792_28400 [Pseudomonadota bacterium]
MKTMITIVAMIVLLVASMSALTASADSSVTQSFDKDACYARCACAMGLFIACAECKAECERKFWKHFDREMGNDTTSKQRGK